MSLTDAERVCDSGLTLSLGVVALLYRFVIYIHRGTVLKGVFESFRRFPPRQNQQGVATGSKEQCQCKQVVKQKASSQTDMIKRNRGVEFRGCWVRH